MRRRLRRWLVGLVVLACAAGLLVKVGTPAAHGVTGQRFLTDAQGRALMLYGLDADGTSAVSSPRAASAEYGLLGDNLTRITLSWSRVEPKPGRYDDAYLAGVAQRIAWYAGQGFHVVLAMQQDAVGPPGTPIAAAPTNEARTRATDEFWRTRGDDPGLQDRFTAAWAHVARYFGTYVSRHGLKPDPILGFDLLDRPWGGSVEGAAFETGPLARLYERLINGLRTVDSVHWLFVEPEAVTAEWGLPSSLPYLVDPRRGEARIGYAPQLYPAPLDPGGRYTGGSVFPTDRALASWAIQVRRTAKRLDAPVLLGGWGLDTTAPGAHLYVDHVQQLIDQLMIGAAFYSAAPGAWSPWEHAGKPAEIAGVLETAYPRAVAGVPVEFDYDKGTLVFTLQFRDAAGVSGPTEIYLPPSDFPRGPQVDFDAEITSSWDPVRHVLSLTVNHPQPGTVHTLHLTPAVPARTFA
ncbi:endoglycosylceramidase [Streptacidiphilus sp. MAP12-20]|uniref:cellulase family glycosylhydrolase n=1 Tax=Streptacidiphilus sp. MAP12-20 TaxID=3156299 RepID=UPI0035153940